MRVVTKNLTPVDVYVADDGKEFRSKQECERYEYYQGIVNNAKSKLHKRIVSHELEGDEYSMLIYSDENTTKEDIISLIYLNNKHIRVDKINFSGTKKGWYLVKEWDGVDYDDYIEVYYADSILKDYNEIINLMKGGTV